MAMLWTVPADAESNSAETTTLAQQPSQTRYLQNPADSVSPIPGVTPHPPLEICGEAKLSVLFWDVYESTLLTPGGQWQPDIRPMRLEIRYLRDIAAEDLIQQTAKEWAAQGIESERHNAWLDQLGQQWRDVTEGDRVALQIDQAGTSTFYFNDEPIGLITDPEFGRDFSGIWLSPKTTRPELRQALIGSAKKPSSPQGDSKAEEAARALQ